MSRWSLMKTAKIEKALLEIARGYKEAFSKKTYNEESEETDLFGRLRHNAVS